MARLLRRALRSGLALRRWKRGRSRSSGRGRGRSRSHRRKNIQTKLSNLNHHFNIIGHVTIHHVSISNLSRNPSFSYTRQILQSLISKLNPTMILVIFILNQNQIPEHSTKFPHFPTSPENHSTTLIMSKPWHTFRNDPFSCNSYLGKIHQSTSLFPSPNKTASFIYPNFQTLQSA